MAYDDWERQEQMLFNTLVESADADTSVRENPAFQDAFENGWLDLAVSSAERIESREAVADFLSIYGIDFNEHFDIELWLRIMGYV